MTSRRLILPLLTGSNNFVKAALTEATSGKAVSVPIDKALRLFRQILSRVRS